MCLIEPAQTITVQGTEREKSRVGLAGMNVGYGADPAFDWDRIELTQLSSFGSLDR